MGVVQVTVRRHLHVGVNKRRTRHAETVLAVWLDSELGELTDDDEEIEKMSLRLLLLHCDHPDGNTPVAVVSNDSLIQADGLILSSKVSTHKMLRFGRRRLKDITTPGVSAGCKSASQLPDDRARREERGT
jgi:hypothetical protein